MIVLIKANHMLCDKQLNRLYSKLTTYHANKIISQCFMQDTILVLSSDIQSFLVSILSNYHVIEFNSRDMR